MSKIALVATTLAVALALSACSPQPTDELGPIDTTAAPAQPAGEPVSLAEGLNVPWSIAVLGDGSALISQRNDGTISELTADGELREIGTVPEVYHQEEDGLLGLAVLDGEWLYAYHTTETDNRVVRFPLTGAPGEYSFDAAAGEEIVTGLRRFQWHNGGRIQFGPDGMLYVTVGDSSDLDLSQDLTSLNGKILRVAPDGAVPDDNPFPGSLIYSYGHRNPQGLAWDDEGQLWASEFGQDSWDELNKIVPGGNYGWPMVEGIADDPAYINPVAQWDTTEASPSGLVYFRGTFFMAALRGEAIWAIYVDGDTVESKAWFAGEFGRIRDVAEGPDGSLWFITSNTDGRGDFREGDDRLYEVQLGAYTG